MKNFLLILLLTLAGCGRSSPPAIPATAGDFVRNNDGVATAQVFGIKFRGTVKSGGASTADFIAANMADPDVSRARKRFTMGDDIAIQLTSVDESEVSFIFNERDFGSLNVGDEVVIDDERNVVVNGAPRLPKSAE